MATPEEAMQELERRAQSGGMTEQSMAAWNELKQRRGFAPPQDTGPVQNTNPIIRPIGMAATGFNQGVGGMVDLMNEGLKMAGLPMNDTPFLGTAFMDKYFAGEQFRPGNMFEAVLHRAGLEVGANVLPLAGAEIVKGVNAGKEIVRAGKEAVSMAGDVVGAAEAKYRALKGIPAAIVEQMQTVGAGKLAAIETALAAGAGTGAELVHQVFPEGGATAEFFGELMGSFAPSVVLSFVSKAKQLAHGVGRAAVGIETDQETRRRLGKTLEPAATKEQVEAGVKRAGELGQEVPGLKLSAGEAITQGSVSDTQLAFEKGSPAAKAKARDVRGQNIEAVKNYFNATEPEGNTTALVERLEVERQSLLASGDSDVARTQAHLDAIRGDIDVRKANLLNAAEARMQDADQRVGQRITALGPQLGKRQRGEIIRQEYHEEVGKFRERSAADYHELDMLGHAELPVNGTLSTLADLQTQFPDHLQMIRKINPRVASVIDRLGHDYELSQRAEKALADLEIRDASGPGFQTVDDLGRPTGGQARGTPQWYTDLSKGMDEKQAKEAGIGGAVRAESSRETIVNSLKELAAGKRPGESGTLAEVAASIKRDGEFRRTPYYDSVMDDLIDTPSASLKDLKQVRSDLLKMARESRAAKPGDVQGYVLQELIGAVDGDIDQLIPGSGAFATRYPDHGTVYRNVSQNYREGVETLYKGTANKLRRMNKYRDYTQDDESLPGLFWKNETSMADFQRALGNQDMARIALRDYALEQFTDKAVRRLPDGRMTIDQSAATEWLNQNRPKLAAFPELEPMFRDSVRMQEHADSLREQVTAYQQGKRGEDLLRRRVEAERRPGDFTQADLSSAETSLKHAEDVATRTKQEWEASKANLFLREPAGAAGYRIATSKDPMGEYEKALSLVKQDPEAVAGLHKAIWEGLTEKIQPRLTGLQGDMNLGVFHKELQNWIEGHGKLMERVLGPEAFNRIKTASEVVQKIARGGRDRSDTAINLQVQAALASTWLSRGFAVASGRVGHVFGVSERVGQHLIKFFGKMTAKQQEAILLESFFDPKVYQTLVNVGQYGPESQIAKHQLRLHLTNLSEQMSGDDEVIKAPTITVKP